MAVGTCSKYSRSLLEITPHVALVGKAELGNAALVPGLLDRLPAIQGRRVGRLLHLRNRRRAVTGLGRTLPRMRLRRLWFGGVGQRQRLGSRSRHAGKLDVDDVLVTGHRDTGVLIALRLDDELAWLAFDDRDHLHVVRVVVIGVCNPLAVLEQLERRGRLAADGDLDALLR